MNQRGFILAGYIAIGALLVIGGLGLALKIQSARLEAVKKEYADFKAKVEFQGRAAQQAADERYAKDLAVKEKANEENKKRIADLSATVGRLRLERPSGNFV